jgi:cupin 2 domain-containing protein
MKSENIFASMPANLDDESVDVLLQRESLKIERIISKGHISPDTGWYDQENDEWVLLLKGAAVINFENENDVNLVVGDYVNIPSHTKHRVKWTDPEMETIWLAVHYK